MLRLVLDTSVLVAAIRSARGASRWLLVAALDRSFNLLVSVPLLLEYEAVLRRPEHLAFAGGTVEDIDHLIETVAGVAERVALGYFWRPRLADRNDEMVLDAAVNGGADAIVTFNTRDFLPEAQRYGVGVMLPRTAVELVRKSPRRNGDHHGRR